MKQQMKNSSNLSKEGLDAKTGTGASVIKQVG